MSFATPEARLSMAASADSVVMRGMTLRAILFREATESRGAGSALSGDGQTGRRDLAGMLGQRPSNI